VDPAAGGVWEIADREKDLVAKVCQGLLEVFERLASRGRKEARGEWIALSEAGGGRDVIENVSACRRSRARWARRLFRQPLERARVNAHEEQQQHRRCRRSKGGLDGVHPGPSTLFKIVLSADAHLSPSFLPDGTNPVSPSPDALSDFHLSPNYLVFSVKDSNLNTFYYTQRNLSQSSTSSPSSIVAGPIRSLTASEPGKRGGATSSPKTGPDGSTSLGWKWRSMDARRIGIG
jgi:hypothetical protein